MVGCLLISLSIVYCTAGRHVLLNYKPAYPEMRAPWIRLLEKKSRFPTREAAVITNYRPFNTYEGWFSAQFSAAAGTAGTLLFHAGQNETLSRGKIDDRAVKHLVRPVLQEHLQSILLKGRVARLGGFGYVHSQ